MQISTRRSDGEGQASGRGYRVLGDRREGPEPATPPCQEVANTLTHGAGVLGSVAVAVLLVWLSVSSGDAWRIVGSAVFATTLVLMYTTSTLYHGIRDSGVKARLRIADHCAIYLLIAGTYTPFSLVGLRGIWGWSLLASVWVLATVGIVLKMRWTGRFPRLSTATYLGMGWLPLVAVVPMIRALSPLTLIWLAVGGIAYTTGTAFYHNRRIPFAHAIWHGFVIVGSFSHAVAVGLHVSPPS